MNMRNGKAIVRIRCESARMIDNGMAEITVPCEYVSDEIIKETLERWGFHDAMLHDVAEKIYDASRIQVVLDAIVA